MSDYLGPILAAAKDAEIMFIASTVIIVSGLVNHFLGIDLLFSIGIGLFVASAPRLLMRWIRNRSKPKHFSPEQFEVISREIERAIEKSRQKPKSETSKEQLRLIPPGA